MEGVDVNRVRAEPRISVRPFGAHHGVVGESLGSRLTTVRSALRLEGWVVFDVDDIIELEYEVMRAVQARDMDALERLVGDGFTLTTGRPGKEVRSREEWMRVTELEYVIDDYKFEELTVQPYEGCAIVRSRYRQEARMGGPSTRHRVPDTISGCRCPTGGSCRPAMRNPSRETESPTGEDDRAGRRGSGRRGSRAIGRDRTAGRGGRTRAIRGGDPRWRADAHDPSGLLGRITLLSERRLSDTLDQLALHLLVHRLEQVGLVGEVVVERPSGDARRGDDVVGRRASEPLLGEDLMSGGDERTGGRLDALSLCPSASHHGLSCIEGSASGAFGRAATGVDGASRFEE